MSDTAINHALLAKRSALANAYYSRIKDCPDYTRKRVTLAMLRDILEHMVFPIVGLSTDFAERDSCPFGLAEKYTDLKALTDGAFAADEQLMQTVREHAAMKARLNDSLEDDE